MSPDGTAPMPPLGGDGIPPGMDDGGLESLLRQLAAVERVAAAASTTDELSLVRSSMTQLSRNLSARFEREQKMSRIYEQLVQGKYLEDVLLEIYDSFRSVIPYDRIGCALLEDGGTRVTARWGRSDAPMRLRPGFTAPMEGSSLQEILLTGQPRIIDDLDEYFEQHPESKSTRLVVAEGIRSSLTCPLNAVGAPVGFLFFSSRTPHAYSAVHQDTFLRLAGVVSVLVDRARSFEELEDLNRQLVLARDQLQWRASHDGMTELLNRRSFLDRLDEECRDSADRDAPLTVMLGDVDRFKSINDTYGHLVGDEVLAEVARRLTRAARPDAVVARYGGEEFVVAVPDNSEPSAAAEAFRRAVGDTPISAGGRELDVTMSIGVARAVPRGPQDADEMLRQADDAMYRAKQLGRNRVEVAAPWSWPAVDARKVVGGEIS